MALFRKKNSAYGVGNPLIDVFPEPIIANRAPTSRDKSELGTVWIDKPNDDVYVITSIVANVATWINAGGGSGSFTSVTASTGNITATAGDIVATVGDLNIVAGDVTIGAFVTSGVVVNSAAGVLSTSRGTDGQFLIADTGTGPDWGDITSTGGSIVVTYPAPNTLNIEATGGTANSYVTTAGGPVAPLLGALDILGYDANITTDGATANTVKVRLADDIVSVSTITASTGFTVTAGTSTITSNTNAADAIYIHADGGVNEQIHIHSDQGTAANSITVESDAGGLVFASGMASADAINITASNAAGGIDVDYGTNGMTVDGANGAFTLQTGTGTVSLANDAFAKDVLLGNATGASSLTLAAGTGNYISTSTGTMLFDCAGVLELNSSAGIIGIGNDNVNQNMNIGTQGERVISIGSATSASQVVLNCGTAGINVGTSATVHTSTLGGTTGASAATIQSGSGAMTFTAGGIFDVNATGAVTIDSTGGALSLGSGANAYNIAIGTGAAERIITIGNATTATSVVINNGTGALELGSNAIAHQVRVGSTTGAANTTIQAGTGNLVINGGGILDIDATGAVTLDGGSTLDANITGAVTVDAGGNISIESSAGYIAIGTDDIDQAVNIATDGERVVYIGSINGAAQTVVSSGTTGTYLRCAGLLNAQPGADSQAGAACTVNTNIGKATFTGLTTAAGAKQQLTINNSICVAGIAIFCTVSNLGANDAKLNIERITTGSGSFTVDVINSGAASLNGNIVVSFWMIA